MMASFNNYQYNYMLDTLYGMQTIIGAVGLQLAMCYIKFLTIPY